MQLPLRDKRRDFLPSLLTAAVLLYIVLFWRLGATSLWDPDEGHYAVTTVEMIASRDWLVPTFNYEPFFDKPIFFHWLQGLSILALGPTDAAVRVAPAVSALGLVLITAWFAAQIAGRRVGLIAGLLLGCNPSVFALARYAILDMPFVMCLFGGVAALSVAAVQQRRQLQFVGFALVGAATCIKGPIAVVLCAVAALIAVVFSAQVRPLLRRLAVVRGLLIIAALSLPWFAYMLWRFGRVFFEGYFLNENLRLFGRSLYVNQPGWWFYLELVILAMLPWTGLVVGRAVDQWRDKVVDPFDVLLWSWIAAVVGFFSFSQFKLDHYVFPAAPALSIVCARAWDDVRRAYSSSPARRRTWTRVGVWMIGPTLVLAGGVLAFLTAERLDLSGSFFIVPGAVVAAGIAATVLYSRSRRLPYAPMIPIVALGVVYLGALGWVIPKLEAGKVVPDIARWVAQNSGPRDRLATFRMNRWNPAFRFYIGRRVDLLTEEAQADQFLKNPQPFYCVMTEPSFKALRERGIPIDVVYRREGLWATSGKALWRVRERPTVFVVAARDWRAGPQ